MYWMIISSIGGLLLGHGVIAYVYRLYEDAPIVALVGLVLIFLSVAASLVTDW